MHDRYHAASRRGPRRLLQGFLACVGSLLILQTALPQDLNPEVKANLLKEQAVMAVRTGDTSAFHRTMDEFRVLEKQGATVPAGLFLAEAETARSRNELLRADRAFNDYFRVALPEGDAFSKALGVYAEFKRSIAEPIWPRLDSMVVVPGGTFTPAEAPGADGAAPTAQNRETAVAQFALARNQVTRAEFLEFVNATERVIGPPAEPGVDTCGAAQLDWRKPGFEQSDRDPVVCVSWNDALAYVGWLNQMSGLRFRLPTAAEWDFAERAEHVATEQAGNQIDTAGGDRPSTVGEDPTGRGTTPTGSVTASSLGLHDMPGKVSEWTADCSESGPSLAQAATDAAAATVPAGCASRVVRGGNWGTVDQPSDTRKRRVLSPDARMMDLGFRIAIDF